MKRQPGRPRGARRRKAVVWIPTVEEWPAVVAAFPEELPPDRKIMLHVMLADKLISFAIGLSEGNRRKLERARALIEEVAQDDPRVLLAAEILTRLLDRPKPKREREPHTRLLRGIFDAYDQVRVRAPAPGMNRPFRGFLDAVLVAFRLGPIDDDGLIGEDDLRGALHHWRKTAHR